MLAGLASSTVPMYIAECAPSHQRGKLVTVYSIFITGGQFIASIVAGIFSRDVNNGWRYMMFCCYIDCYSFQTSQHYTVETLCIMLSWSIIVLGSMLMPCEVIHTLIHVFSAGFHLSPVEL